MRLTSYLFFKGDCEEAFKFYEKTFGGQIVAMIPHAGTPAAEHVSAEMQDKIIHARLRVGDAELMGSDGPPEMYEPVQGFRVSIHVDTPAEAERIYHALAEGGTVAMEIQETFWSARFAMLTDRFGTPWMINCEQKE